MGFRQRALDAGLQNIMGGLRTYADLSAEEDKNKRARALQDIDRQIKVSSLIERPMTDDEIEGYRTGDITKLSNVFADISAKSKSDRETKKALASLGLEKTLLDVKKGRAEEIERNKPPEQKTSVLTDIAKKAAEGKLKKEQEIEEQKRLATQIEVPGFERESEKNIIKPDDVKFVKGASSLGESVTNSVGKIIELLEKSGPTLGAPTEANELLKQQVQLLSLQLKNKEVFDLGVLNGPDVEILETAIGAVTGPKAYLLGKNAAIERIKNAASFVTDKILSNAKSRGFRPTENYKSLLRLGADRKSGLSPTPTLAPTPAPTLDARTLELLQKASPEQRKFLGI